MTTPEAPKIEFPCDYGIKVVADRVDGFEETVVSIATKHDPDFDPATVRITASSKGTYQSFNFRIQATGEDQLKALFEDFKATGHVHFVL